MTKSTISAKAESETTDQPNTELDDDNFIRSKIFAPNQSAFARYRSLVFHRFSWPRLFRYELLVTIFGPIPGALGFVLRKRLFRFLFRKVGKGVLFGRNLTLNHADQITLGDNVVLDRDCVLDARGGGEAGIVIGDRVIINRGACVQAKVGFIQIGSNCNIGSNVDLIAQGPIILEDNVSIATKAVIAGGRYVVEQDPDAPGAKRRFSGGEIRIGRNCRVGMGAIIQDGVKVGENAIVAPGSVVYEDVAANSVVWGNPARPVRHRSSIPADAGKVTPATPDSAGTPELQRQVCSYLENDLFIEFGPDGFGTGESLLDSGIMDSLALVRLLSWIEQQYDVDLDFSEMDTSDIDTVDKIVARVNAHRN